MEAFISIEEQVILEKACRSKKTEQRIVERSRVILNYSLSGNKSELSRTLQSPRTFISRWVKRWRDKAGERKVLLQELQQGIISVGKYEKNLLGLLADEQRSGARLTFSAHQRQQLMAMACESPTDFGLPFTHWTHQLLSEQAKKTGIDISPRHLGRILKTGAATTTSQSVLATAGYK